MSGELNNDFYCSAEGKVVGRDGAFFVCCLGECGKCGCNNYHRKWPTPEQFKEEYGEEYSDDGAVYYLHLDATDWLVSSYWENVKDYYKEGKCLAVCACTPFGKPNEEWRP